MKYYFYRFYNYLVLKVKNALGLQSRNTIQEPPSVKEIKNNKIHGPKSKINFEEVNNIIKVKNALTLLDNLRKVQEDDYDKLRDLQKNSIAHSVQDLHALHTMSLINFL